jgi:hypothetical protein
MDYAKRNEIEFYRPLIDDALIRIVKVSDGDVEQAQAALDAVEHDAGPWGYLNKATAAVREIIDMDNIDEVLPYDWVTGFLQGRWDNAEIPMYCVDSYDDVDPHDFMMPVVLEYYPEESHECLQQQFYVGGGDADIIALWKREDRTSVCHAHMEGFWILGEDPADFIERYATKLEEKLAEVS